MFFFSENFISNRLNDKYLNGSVLKCLQAYVEYLFVLGRIIWQNWQKTKACVLIKVHILPRRQLFKLNTNFKHHSHPGIYSIKLYGSVNYRFEVTAKFCRKLPNFNNLRPFCQKLQIKNFYGTGPLGGDHFHPHLLLIFPRLSQQWPAGLEYAVFKH